LEIAVVEEECLICGAKEECRYFTEKEKWTEKEENGKIWEHPPKKVFKVCKK